MRPGPESFGAHGYLSMGEEGEESSLSGKGSIWKGTSPNIPNPGIHQQKLGFLSTSHSQSWLQGSNSDPSIPRVVVLSSTGKPFHHPNGTVPESTICHKLFYSPMDLSSSSSVLQGSWADDPAPGFPNSLCTSCLRFLDRLQSDKPTEYPEESCPSI